MHVMAYIDWYLYLSLQASVSYRFSSIDTSIHFDADAGVQCGQGLKKAS